MISHNDGPTTARSISEPLSCHWPAEEKSQTWIMIRMWIVSIAAHLIISWCFKCILSGAILFFSGHHWPFPGQRFCHKIIFYFLVRKLVFHCHDEYFFMNRTRFFTMPSTILFFFHRGLIFLQLGPMRPQSFEKCKDLCSQAFFKTIVLTNPVNFNSTKQKLAFTCEFRLFKCYNWIFFLNVH